MVTAHGVKMSPRMERLYTFFQIRGIAISSWSTDAHVAAEMPNLRAAASDIEAEMAGFGHRVSHAVEFLRNSSDSELEALAADVAAIMRRTPAARAR